MSGKEEGREGGNDKKRGTSTGLATRCWLSYM